MNILDKTLSGISKARNCRNAIALIAGISLAAPAPAAVVLNAMEVRYSNNVSIIVQFDGTTVFADGPHSLGLGDFGSVVQHVELRYFGNDTNSYWGNVDAADSHDYPELAGNSVLAASIDFDVFGPTAFLLDATY